MSPKSRSPEITAKPLARAWAAIWSSVAVPSPMSRTSVAPGRLASTGKWATTSDRERVVALPAQLAAGKGEAGPDVVEGNPVVFHDGLERVPAGERVEDHGHRGARPADDRLAMTDSRVHDNAFIHRSRSGSGLSTYSHLIRPRHLRTTSWRTRRTGRWWRT